MIKLKNVIVGYNNNPVLNDFNGTFEFSNLNVLFGKNGIGKSTLLDVISGLKKLRSGTLQGAPSPKKIMYMFQSTPFNTDITVQQFLNMYSSFWKKTSFEIYKINVHNFFVENILPLCNIFLGDLSGGEKKLVFTYASAMVLKSLYLFDEPLSGVDVENQAKIVNLLEILGTKIPVIMTSHELEPFKNINCTLKYISPKRFIFSGNYTQLIQKYGPSSKTAFLNLTQEMRGEQHENIKKYI